MKVTLGLLGVLGLLTTLGTTGCVVGPAYPAAGGTVSIHGEYPAYSQGYYYRDYRYHHAYDRDHYYYRPYPYYRY
jgi:hypothetical protein